jgi:hypothetical protein
MIGLAVTARWRTEMALRVGALEAESRFSELMETVAYGHDLQAAIAL